MATDFAVSREVYRDAYRAGMTLSAFLETLDPTHKYAAADLCAIGSDAYTRKLRELDIRTRSIPELGIPAHTVQRFYDDSDGKGEERKAMFPEWLARTYRQACPVVPRSLFGTQMPSGGPSAQRLIVSGTPLSDALDQGAVDSIIRFLPVEPSLLSFIVAMTRTIDSDTFTAFYLDDTAILAAAHMKRVGEYAEVPGMRITGGDHTMKVHKYGRKFMASYEAMRRMSIDLVAFSIQYIAAVADNDKFATALDVIVNGDGNTGTAATNTNGSTLDAAAAGALTLKMWLAWTMLWTKPHMANVAIAQNAGILQLLLLNAGSANLPPQAIVGPTGAVGAITLARPIYGGMVAINDASAPANKIVGLDSRFTLEMVTEAGADIQEVDRVISAQYEQVVITESVGFDIKIKGQNRTLAYTA